MNTDNIIQTLNTYDQNGGFDNIEVMNANETVTVQFDDVSAVITKDCDFNGKDFNLVSVDFRMNDKSIASTCDIHVDNLKGELTDIMVNGSMHSLIDCVLPLEVLVNEMKKAIKLEKSGMSRD